MPQLTMKDMLDAGVHFGHQTQRWNPKMKPYVYTDRGGIHIIDLQKSVVSAKNAADFVRGVAAEGGRMIFVGTKKQAVEPIREAAQKCGQYFVTKRWLGGMLTNFQTIKSSIDRLKKYDQMREKGELEFFSKKERARMEKDYLRLNDYLDGIRDMKDAPVCMFVVDLNKEHIAVKEAVRMGIKVVGIADTNVDPETIDYPIPGNDDAIRSIKLFANLVADAYLEGAEKYKEAIRASGNRPVEGRTERPQEERTQQRTRGDAPASPGPSVVKVNKGRKLVAAGTAEDVEILMELEQPQAPEADADADAAAPDAAAPATAATPAKTDKA
jgi:small subunit ribosomal protein S2